MNKAKIKLIKKDIAPSNEEVFLEFKIDWEFDFQTWQFVMMSINIDWQMIKRAYSIATSNERLQKDWIIGFYVKKASENWASNYLTQVIKEWDEIDITWPFWHYVDKKDKKNYLLLSVWSWLGPNLGLYDQIVNVDNDFDKLVNFFWEKTKRNIPDEVNKSFADNNEKILNKIYLSREKLDWYEEWYIQNWIDEALEFLGTNDIKVFICGKPEMVDDMIEKLINKWIDKENILYEKY